MSASPKLNVRTLRRDAFLGVERSVRGRRWVPRLVPGEENLALAIAQRTGMSDLVSRILVGRGATVADAETFLTPRLRDLMPDPATMTDCTAAAERIALAVRKKQRVAIFGDYDVDGASSSALVARVLSVLGCDTEIYIPDRITEGYGPNVPAMKALCERGAELIVTVDCGTMSFDAIDAARAFGIDTVVIDHHQTGVDLPEAVALVNPNRQDDLSGLGYLCATGVAFMVMVALRRELGATEFPDLFGLLDLVALATVCDMVPLKALNRALVVQGLTIMRRKNNVGLDALARVSRVTRALDTGHLGFAIGPRINAGGRVGDASLGAKLLTETDVTNAERIAGKLETYNRERQAIETQVLDDAEIEVRAEMNSPSPPSAIIAANDGWHPGVVGLVASRLKERYDRPAFAIGFDASGRGSGSGRSVPSLDIGALVRRATDEGLLVKGGGHAMAAGLTIERERLGAFRRFVEEEVDSRVAMDSMPELEVDGAIATSGATVELIEEIERAGPYGIGHPKPLVILPEQTIVDARRVGTNHIAVRLKGSDGVGLKAIAFRAAGTDLGQFLQDHIGDRAHIAGTLDIDDYKGGRNANLRIEDAAET